MSVYKLRIPGVMGYVMIDEKAKGVMEALKSVAAESAKTGEKIRNDTPPAPKL